MVRPAPPVCAASRRRVELLARVVERQLLDQLEPGLDAARRSGAAAGRGDVDDLDAAQVVAGGGARELAPAPRRSGARPASARRSGERSRADWAGRAPRHPPPWRSAATHRRPSSTAEDRVRGERASRGFCPRGARRSMSRCRPQTVVLILNERLIRPNQKPDAQDERQQHAHRRQPA